MYGYLINNMHGKNLHRVINHLIYVYSKKISTASATVIIPCETDLCNPYNEHMGFQLIF